MDEIIEEGIDLYEDDSEDRIEVYEEKILLEDQEPNQVLTADLDVSTIESTDLGVPDTDTAIEVSGFLGFLVELFGGGTASTVYDIILNLVETGSNYLVNKTDIYPVVVLDVVERDPDSFVYALENVLGKYQQRTTTTIYYDGNGDIKFQEVATVDGIAGMDIPWICGAVLFTKCFISTIGFFKALLPRMR